MSSDCSTYIRFYKAVGLAFSYLKQNKVVHFICIKCSVIKDMNVEFLRNSKFSLTNSGVAALWQLYALIPNQLQNRSLKLNVSLKELRTA